MEKEILREQQRTNELLERIIIQENSDNELLTIEQVSKEFDIGKVKVQKMFNDPELPVQRYTKPFKVQRKALNKYFETSHDWLCQ